MTNASNGVDSTSGTILIPNDVAADDMLFASVAVIPDATIVGPADWTLVQAVRRDEMTVSYYRKISMGTERGTNSTWRWRNDDAPVVVRMWSIMMMNLHDYRVAIDPPLAAVPQCL